MVSRVRDALISAGDISDLDRCLQALQALSDSLAEVFPRSSVANKDVIIQMFVYPGDNLLSILNYTSTGRLAADKDISAARAQLYSTLSASVIASLNGTYALGSRNANRPVFRALAYAAYKLLLRERGSTAQQAVAELLRAILESDLIEPDDVDLKSIAYDCMEVASASKVGATAKENVLALLGRLVSLSSEAMPELTRRIFRLGMHELYREMEAARHGSGAKSGIVSGALRALASVLEVQDELISGKEGGAYLETIFEAAFVRGTVIEQGQTRFAVTEASLQLIASHALLFRRKIRDTMGGLLPRLHALCHCKHERVVKAAPDAFMAAIEQISEYFLLEASVSPLCMQVFRGYKPANGTDADPGGSKATSGSSAAASSASSSGAAGVGSSSDPPDFSGSIPMVDEGSDDPALLDLKHLDDELAKLSPVEGQRVVKARDARVDFGLLFSFCVDMMKGEATPWLAVAVKQLCDASGGATGSPTSQALVECHETVAQRKQALDQCSSAAQRLGTTEAQYGFVRSRDEYIDARRRCAQAAYVAIASFSGGGIQLKYRKKDDVFLGCRSFAVLAAVTQARFGDSVVSLLARRVPLIVRDAADAIAGGDDASADREGLDDTSLSAERQMKKQLASVSTKVKRDCLALSVSFRMLTCCRYVEPDVIEQLAAGMSRAACQFPVVTTGKSGGRQAICSALFWMCECMRTHPATRSNVLSAICAPLAYVALSRRHASTATLRLEHPVTKRPVTRLVFEMVPLFIYLCRGPSELLYRAIMATRRRRSVVLASGAAAASQSAASLSPIENDSAAVLLYGILEVVLSVLQEVDLSLSVSGPGAAPSGSEHAGEDIAVLTATMSGDVGYAAGPAQPSGPASGAGSGTNATPTVPYQARPRSYNDYWAFSACADLLVCILPNLDANQLVQIAPQVMDAVENLLQEHSHEYRLYTLACAVIHAIDVSQPILSGQKGSQAAMTGSDDIYADQTPVPNHAMQSIRRLAGLTLSNLHGFQGMVLSQAVRFLCAIPASTASTGTVVAAMKALLSGGASQAAEHPDLVVAAIDSLEARLATRDGLADADLALLLPVLLQLLDADDGPVFGLEQLVTERMAARLSSAAASPSAADDLTTGVRNLLSSRVAAPYLRRFYSNESVRVHDAQLRLVSFIGRLGPRAMECIPSATGALVQESFWTAASVGSQVVVRANVPVDDFIEVDILRLVPRLSEIARTGGSKQSRVSALEALHASFMIIIGQPSVQAAVLSKVFEASLELASGSDPIAAQVFQPLLHYLVRLLHSYRHEPEKRKAIAQCWDCCEQGMLHHASACRSLSSYILLESGAMLLQLELPAQVDSKFAANYNSSWQHPADELVDDDASKASDMSDHPLDSWFIRIDRVFRSPSQFAKASAATCLHGLLSRGMQCPHKLSALYYSIIVMVFRASLDLHGEHDGTSTAGRLVASALDRARIATVRCIARLGQAFGREAPNHKEGLESGSLEALLNPSFVLHVLRLGIDSSAPAASKMLILGVGLAAIDETASSGSDRRTMATLVAGLQRKSVPIETLSKCGKLLQSWASRHNMSASLTPAVVVRSLVAIDADSDESSHSKLASTGIRLASLRSLVRTCVVSAHEAYSSLFGTDPASSSGNDMMGAIADFAKAASKAIGGDRGEFYNVTVEDAVRVVNELQMLLLAGLKALPNSVPAASSPSSGEVAGGLGDLFGRLLQVLGSSVFVAILINPVDLVSACCSSRQPRAQQAVLWHESRLLMERLDAAWRSPALEKCLSSLDRESVKGKAVLLHEITRSVGSMGLWESVVCASTIAGPASNQGNALLLLVRLAVASKNSFMLKGLLPCISELSDPGSAWVEILYEDRLGEALLASEGTLLFSEFDATRDPRRHCTRLLLGALTTQQGSRSISGATYPVIRFLLADGTQADKRVHEALSRISLFAPILSWVLLASESWQWMCNDFKKRIESSDVDDKAAFGIGRILCTMLSMLSIAAERYGSGSASPSADVIRSSITYGLDSLKLAERIRSTIQGFGDSQAGLPICPAYERADHALPVVAALFNRAKLSDSGCTPAASLVMIDFLESTIRAHQDGVPSSSSMSVLSARQDAAQLAVEVFEWLSTRSSSGGWSQEEARDIYLGSMQRLAAFGLPSVYQDSFIPLHLLEVAPGSLQDTYKQLAVRVLTCIESGVVSRYWPISWDAIGDQLSGQQMHALQVSSHAVIRVFADSGCIGLLRPAIMGRLFEAQSSSSSYPPSIDIALSLDVALRMVGRRAHATPSLRECLLACAFGGAGAASSSRKHFRSIVEELFESAFGSSQTSLALISQSMVLPFLQSMQPKELVASFGEMNGILQKSIAYAATECIAGDIDLYPYDSSDAEWLQGHKVRISFALLAVLFDRVPKEVIDSSIQPKLFIPGYKLVKTIRDCALKLLREASSIPLDDSTGATGSSSEATSNIMSGILEAAILCWSRAVGQTQSQSKWLAQVFCKIPDALALCCRIPRREGPRYLSDPSLYLPEVVVSSSSSVLSLPPLPSVVQGNARLALGSISLNDVENLNAWSSEKPRDDFAVAAASTADHAEFGRHMQRSKGVADVTQALGLGTQADDALDSADSSYKSTSQTSATASSSQYGSDSRPQSEGLTSAVDAEHGSVFEAVELDPDSSHTVYFALLKLVDVLIEEFSVSAERRGGPYSALRDGEEPRWVHYLASIIENTKLPLAARTVAARLVMSRSVALKPFWSRLLVPVLCVAAETLPAPRMHSSDAEVQRAADAAREYKQHYFGVGIHHFARDAAELLLEWSPVDLSKCRCPCVPASSDAVPAADGSSNVQQAVSTFINRCIGAALSSNSIVYRSNKRLVLALIETVASPQGLYDQYIGTAASYSPPILQLELNPLCLAIVSQDTLLNRGAYLSMQDTAAALAIECMLTAATHGITLHDGTTASGMDWKLFYRSFLLNAIPAPTKSIRVPSGKVLRRTKRDRVVLLAYSLLGVLHARRDERLVPEFDIKPVIALLRQHTLGTATYAPVLFLRGLTGLARQDPGVVSGDLLDTVLRLGVSSSVKSKKQSAAAMRTAEACLDCLLAVSRGSDLILSPSHAVQFVRVLAACLGSSSTSVVRLALNAALNVQNQLPGSVLVRLLGSKASVVIPKYFEEAMAVSRGVSVLARAQESKETSSAVLSLLAGLLHSHEDLQTSVLSTTSGSIGEMLKSQDKETRGRGTREALVLANKSCEDGGDRESERRRLRGVALYYFYAAAFAYPETWTDVELADSSSVRSQLLRQIQPGGHLVLPSFPASVVTMLSDFLPVASVGSKFSEVKQAADSQTYWQRCCAAAVAVSACNTESNSSAIHHSLAGGDEGESYRVDVSLSQTAASVFEGDDGAPSSAKSLDPAAIASLLPQGTVGTRSGSIATLCSQGMQDVVPVYEMSQWLGPSVDPEIATQMLQNVFASVGLSQDDDAGESPAATSSSMHAAYGQSVAATTQAYTSAPLFRISTQSEKGEARPQGRSKQVDPELAVPRRVARHLWKDHLKSSFTYSKRERYADASNALRSQSGKEVRVHRAYRRGAMPDVSVSAADLMKPLAVLASCNDSIASELFSCAMHRLSQGHRESISAAGYRGPGSASRPADIHSVIDCISSAVSKVSGGGSAASLALVRSLDTACSMDRTSMHPWKSESIAMEPSTLVAVTDSGRPSAAAAALLLEDMLIQASALRGGISGPSQSSPPRKRRSRGTSSTAASSLAGSAAQQLNPPRPEDEQSAWLSLVEMYDRIDEDSLLAIGISDTVPESMQVAATMECKRELHGALKQYGYAVMVSAPMESGLDSKEEDDLDPSSTSTSMDDSAVQDPAVGGVKLDPESSRHFALLRYKRACEQLGKWKELNQLSEGGRGPQGAAYSLHEREAVSSWSSLVENESESPGSSKSLQSSLLSIYASSVHSSDEWTLPRAAKCIVRGDRVTASKLLELGVMRSLYAWREGSAFDPHSRRSGILSMWHCSEIAERISSLVLDDTQESFRASLSQQLSRSLLDAPDGDLFSIHKTVALRGALFSRHAFDCLPRTVSASPAVLDMAAASQVSARSSATVACIRTGQFKAALKMCKSAISQYFPASGLRGGQVILRASSPAAIALIDSAYLQSRLQKLSAESNPARVADLLEKANYLTGRMAKQLIRSDGALRDAATQVIGMLRHQLGAAALEAPCVQDGLGGERVDEAVVASLRSGLMAALYADASAVQDEEVLDAVDLLLDQGMSLGPGGPSGLLHAIAGEAPSTAASMNVSRLRRTKYLLSFSRFSAGLIRTQVDAEAGVIGMNSDTIPHALSALPSTGRGGLESLIYLHASAVLEAMQLGSSHASALFPSVLAFSHQFCSIAVVDNMTKGLKVLSPDMLQAWTPYLVAFAGAACEASLAMPPGNVDEAEAAMSLARGLVSALESVGAVSAQRVAVHLRCQALDNKDEELSEASNYLEASSDSVGASRSAASQLAGSKRKHPDARNASLQSKSSRGSHGDRLSKRSRTAGSASSSSGSGRAGEMAAGSAAVSLETKRAAFTSLFGPLQARVRSPVLDRFFTAVEDLQSPYLRVVDWVKATLKAAKGLSPAVRKMFIQDQWEQFLPWVIRSQDRSSPAAVRSTVASTDFKAVLRNAARGRSSQAPTFEDLQQWYYKLKGVNPGAAHSKTTDLRSLSPWLSEYRSTAFPLSDRIEMPTLWASAARKDESSATENNHRVHISSFAPAVLVLKSLRVPRRLTVFGSDDRTHRFLAKAGEDIRLDDRITGMLETCNRLAARLPASRQRGLFVQTYAAVPTSPSSGLIEWVDGTTTLMEVLASNANIQGWHAIANDPDASAMANSIKNTTRYPYLYMTPHASNPRVEAAHDTAVYLTAAGSIRYTICDQSSSPASFFARRNLFVRSFSATSAATYLLGLGDRHLENFLIRSDTMAVFPIDFGAAFGLARCLPVPELIPIRCSPCIRRVTGPVDGRFHVHVNLNHAFEALLGLDGRGELSSMLEVFVAEPITEWYNAVVAAHGNGASTGSPADPAHQSEAGAVGFSSESAARKVAIARLRLNKAHPASVQAQELQMNKLLPDTVKSAMSTFMQAAGGMDAEPSGAGRSDSEKSSESGGNAVLSSSFDLAAAILSMSTDSSICSRQWHGLCLHV